MRPLTQSTGRPFQEGTVLEHPPFLEQPRLYYVLLPNTVGAFLTTVRIALWNKATVNDDLQEAFLANCQDQYPHVLGIILQALTSFQPPYMANNEAP